MSLLLLFRPARERPAAMGSGPYRKPFVRKRKPKTKPFEIDFTPRSIAGPATEKPTPIVSKAIYEPFVEPEIAPEPVALKFKDLIEQPLIAKYDPTQGLREILKRELPKPPSPSVPEEVAIIVEVPNLPEEMPIVIEEPPVVELPQDEIEAPTESRQGATSLEVRDDLSEILFVLGLLEGDEDLYLLSLGEQDDRYPLFQHPSWTIARPSRK